MGPAVEPIAPLPPTRRHRGENRPGASRSAPGPPPAPSQTRRGSCRRLQQPDDLAEKSQIDPRANPHDRAADRDRWNRRGFPPPPKQNRMPVCLARRPRPIETPAASRRVDCDAACCATPSRLSSPPVPGSPRQSPPSPHRSSAAAVASRSEPPPGGNCAHQLANYLAHDPPALVNEGSFTPSPSAAGAGQAPLTLHPSARTKQIELIGGSGFFFLERILGIVQPWCINSPVPTSAHSLRLGCRQ